MAGCMHIFPEFSGFCRFLSLPGTRTFLRCNPRVAMQVINACVAVIRCNFGRLRVVRFRHSENARVALITVSSGMEVDVARQPDGA